MGRTRPADRPLKVLEAAMKVFIETGYRRAQMADIARELGLSKGALYLYADSKEALFDRVLRYAVEGQVPNELPFSVPQSESTFDYLRGVISAEARWPKLDAALADAAPPELNVELAGIVDELFTLMTRFRNVLRVLSKSALDWPELGMVFIGELRVPLLGALTRYFEQRVEQGRARILPNAHHGAVFVNETVAFWAIHRHGDPGYAAIAEAAARAIVVDVLGHAFEARETH